MGVVIITGILFPIAARSGNIRVLNAVYTWILSLVGSGKWPGLLSTSNQLDGPSPGVTKISHPFKSVKSDGVT
ncbi:hypothetical protein LI328DRAFT_1586 [Trichoderma asperelloides]|nr:hypothetical protein LI328DRAFT_1586 [Trichoderma asperelloides]